MRQQTAKRTTKESYNTSGQIHDESLNRDMERYVKNAKPRQEKIKKAGVMQVMSVYRNHLCDLHTDENGVRKCITGHCPLSFSTCYNHASFEEYFCSSPAVVKRKTKKLIKEAMKEENWPDLDKL